MQPSYTQHVFLNKVLINVFADVGEPSLCCVERNASEDVINLHFIFRDSGSFVLSLHQETLQLLVMDFLFEFLF